MACVDALVLCSRRGWRALTRSTSLLQAAAELFDSNSELQAAAWNCVCSKPEYGHGFAAGAQWMAKALSVVRGNAVTVPELPWNRMGIAKYGAALLAMSFGVLAAAATGRLLLLVFAPLLFYAVEAQFVFLFPILLDGSGTPWRDSLRFTRRAGGTISVMTTVMPIAVVMLFAGVAQRGFVRGWCLGCLAIVLWYEKLKS